MGGHGEEVSQQTRRCSRPGGLHERAAANGVHDRLCPGCLGSGICLGLTRSQSITALRFADVVRRKAGNRLAQFRREHVERGFVAGLQFEFDFRDRRAARLAVATSVNTSP